MNPYEAPKIRAGASRTDQGAGEKPFAVTCGCGQRIGVAPNQAGSRVDCSCGVAVPVPSLGKLREMIGMGRYESSPADTIRRMIADGEWPGTTVCSKSGRRTDDVLDVWTVVTSQFLNTGDSKAGLAFGLFGLWGLLWAARAASRPAEPVPGTEEAVPTPLRLESRYHAWAFRSADRMRVLLAKSPVYEQLLDQYPEARFVIGYSEDPPAVE